MPMLSREDWESSFSFGLMKALRRRIRMAMLRIFIQKNENRKFKPIVTSQFC